MAHYVGYGWACCWRDALAGCLSSVVLCISDLGEKFSGPEILEHVRLWLRIFGNTRISWEDSVNTRCEALVTHS